MFGLVDVKAPYLVEFHRRWFARDKLLAALAGNVEVACIVRCRGGRCGLGLGLDDELRTELTVAVSSETYTHVREYSLYPHSRNASQQLYRME